VTTLAGSATQGMVDGPVATATLRWVTDIVADSAGNIFLIDSSSHKIRKISAAGVVSSIAGSHLRNAFADGPGLTVAAFNTPWGIAIDATGDRLFVGDYHNHRVRKITLPPA
jgi:DNA-binding beta-propeller fold protein YncE